MLVGLGPGVIVKVGPIVGVNEGISVGIGCSVLVDVVVGTIVPVGDGAGAGWQAFSPKMMTIERKNKLLCTNGTRFNRFRVLQKKGNKLLLQSEYLITM